MAITTVLFDLDGTLLPQDQDVFLKSYFSRLVRKLAPHGYDPDLTVKAIWKCTGAMINNDGSCTNEHIRELGCDALDSFSRTSSTECDLRNG